MIKLDDVVEFIHNPLAYEQKLVSVINTKGEQITLCAFSELYSNEPITIKIEGLEKYSYDIWNKCQELGVKYKHIGPITCHAFIAKINSPSFSLHIDPDDVIICCIEGRKKLFIQDEYIIMETLIKDINSVLNNKRSGSNHELIQKIKSLQKLLQKCNNRVKALQQNISS